MRRIPKYDKNFPLHFVSPEMSTKPLSLIHSVGDGKTMSVKPYTSPDHPHSDDIYDRLTSGTVGSHKVRHKTRENRIS